MDDVLDALGIGAGFRGLGAGAALRARDPIFLARDELPEYFARYVELHGLAPHLRFGVRVARVRRIAQPQARGWPRAPASS